MWLARLGAARGALTHMWDVGLEHPEHVLPHDGVNYYDTAAVIQLMEMGDKRWYLERPGLVSDLQGNKQAPQFKEDDRVQPDSSGLFETQVHPLHPQH